MEIVVLDGYTLNPGDLDWAPLYAFGMVQIYDRTAPDQIWRAGEAEIVFTNKAPLDAAALERLPKLKYIGVLATGYDVIDIETARKRGITVTNIPDYGAESVAQMTFAHILNITNNVAGHAADVAAGGWSRTDDYCYWLTPQVELKDKVLGIIGFGEIGRAAARLGQAFGMRVLVVTRTPPADLSGDIRLVDLEELLRKSDIITLHCPLTEATRALINDETIGLMKESAILVNCSRGQLIDEEALARALENDRIRAACLDVLSREPVRGDNPLIGAKNCYITPHIAWATREARSRLLGIAADNLRAFLAGKPQNVIS